LFFNNAIYSNYFAFVSINILPTMVFYPQICCFWPAASFGVIWHCYKKRQRNPNSFSAN